MKLKNMNKYLKIYKKGLVLINKNLIVFFVGIFITLGPQINKIFADLGLAKNPFIDLISFVFSLFAAGSLLLTVKTLFDASEKKKVDLNLLVDNYKQTFSKSIKAILVLTLFAIIWFVFISMRTQFSFIFNNSTLLQSLILTLFFPVFLYFEIYYAVKNQSLLSSFLLAMKFYKKNLLFISLSLVYYLINWFIQSVDQSMFITRSPFFYIYQFITIYFGLIVTSASVLYFKENDKNK